jgi:hypothetical protein
MLSKLFLGMCNRVLNDDDRGELADVINTMFKLTPEMMSRKPYRANVQQAFGVAGVLETSNKTDEILCVGSFEDTCADTLLKLGYNVICIDSQVNMDLHTYKEQNPDKKFKTIFSISVLEHVNNDIGFIADICNMLEPEGIAIITTDFLDTYDNSMSKPHFAERFYTHKTMLTDLMFPIYRFGCHLVSNANWFDSTPDFEYQGYTYNLATLVFKKV